MNRELEVVSAISLFRRPLNRSEQDMRDALYYLGCLDNKILQEIKKVITDEMASDILRAALFFAETPDEFQPAVAWILSLNKNITFQSHYDRGDRYDQKTPLMLAAKNSHLAAVNSLVDCLKVDVSFQNEEEDTALNFSVCAKDFSSTKKILSRYTDSTLKKIHLLTAMTIFSEYAEYHEDHGERLFYLFSALFTNSLDTANIKEQVLAILCNMEVLLMNCGKILDDPLFSADDLKYLLGNIRGQTTDALNAREFLSIKIAAKQKENTTFSQSMTP